MSRKEYYDKLKKWEAEGYDVSELREKWFPAKKAGGEGLKWKWIAIASAIFIVVVGVIIWQVWPEPVRTVLYVPAQPSEPVYTPPLPAAVTPFRPGYTWAWGQNTYGQLGNGTTTNSNTPVRVSIDGVISAVSAGWHHNLAVKPDGTVWAWGNNSWGQLGEGTTNDSNVPLQVKGINGVTAVGGGVEYSLALKSDGTVWVWGGQTRNKSGIPVQVEGLGGITAIAAGGGHSLALKNDGTVWAWGNNSFGQLGNDSTVASNTPVQVQGLSGITAIAAGGLHSLALKNDSTVWAWGNNKTGQLGDGTTVANSIPVQVESLSGITAIAAGGYHSLALKNDGAVWAWGDNFHGQIGTEGSPSRNSNSVTKPFQVVLISNVAKIAAGSNHSLAIKNDGTVWAWGYISGQLGNAITTNTNTPTQVNIDGVATVSGGFSHSIALKNDGTVWAWGGNLNSTLGNGTSPGIPTPMQTYMSELVAIAAGEKHSLALKNDGTVWAWGDNFRGELGNGSFVAASPIPQQVSSLNNITAIAAGAHYNLALKSDGTLRSWGCGIEGVNPTPSVVSGVSGIRGIAVGNNHSLALGTDGTVWAWGDNSAGQLGNSDVSESEVPIQVQNLNGVDSVAAGYQSSLALKSDGTVWAWGLSSHTIIPQQVNGLSEISAIAAGGGHNLVLKTDGIVWAWGENSSGQLGNGTFTNSDVPVQVSGLREVVLISAGGSHSLALRSDGSVWAWGENNYGQLGGGMPNDSNVPVQVSGLSGIAAVAAGINHNLAIKGDSTLNTPVTPTPIPIPTPISPVPSQPEITSAQPLTLKFATALMPMSSEYLAIYKPMMDEIEQKSNGRIKFDVYPGGAAASAAEQYDAISSGAVDMGVSYFSYIPDRYPLSDAFAFPVAYDMTDAGEDLIQALGNHIFALKPSETKILCFFQQQPYFLYTARKQVKTLDDLKGLKVRANVSATRSLQASTLQSLGAVPVALSSADLYEAIQRGVIDGALATPAVIDIWKLTDVTQYALRLPLGYDVGMINISPGTWSKLPDDLKSIIENVAGKARYNFVQQFNIDDAKVNNILTGQGGAVYTLSAAEQTQWANAIKPAIDKWIADTEGKGWPAEDLVKTIRIECQKQGVPFPY